MKLTKLVLLVALSGCAVAAHDAVSPPGTDVTYCDSACAVLNELACEAWTPNCIPSCQNAFSSGFIRLPSKCVSEQTTREGVRSCGARCSK